MTIERSGDLRGEPGPEASAVTQGWCAAEVGEVFPELRLLVEEISLGQTGLLAGGSPPGIKERLRTVSDRWAGAQAVMVRRQPVPAAYRVFYRHIGLDPDVQRTPLERAILERMLDGGFRSRGLLHDVLLLALVDTGIAVWALDAETLDGPLGTRLSVQGEPLGRGEDAAGIAGGQLVVADASAALALLFGEPAPGHGAGPGTRRVALFALQVAGVPALHVEEALWSCRTTLESVTATR